MRISDWSSDVCSSDLFTLYHPGECLQADVRMRPHAHSGPGFEHGGTGMIEKEPGADGALLARWQDAIHCNAAADFGAARRNADRAGLAVRRSDIRGGLVGYRAIARGGNVLTGAQDTGSPTT